MAVHNQSIQRYQNLPKVELHRHLEGTLRLSTMVDVAKTSPIHLPEGARENLRALVQVQAGDPYTFRNFLSKFETLRLFYHSPEIIQRVAREAVEDAAADNIHYMELSFTPVALSRKKDFHLGDVMDWVVNSAQEAARQSGLILRLILNVNRHEPVELAEEVLRLGLTYRDRGVVGLSLAGNEVDCLGEDFAPVFRKARAAGLKCTIHAGEWAGPESVRFAMEVLEADRIAHGVRILEDESLVAQARDQRIPFEVCITSNYQSGVVPEITAHPLMAMLAAGLNVTINTDDPGISSITLSDEYWQACETLGLSLSALKAQILAAARAAFLTPVERAALLARLREALSV